jgi:hypothetical protein
VLPCTTQALSRGVRPVQAALSGRRRRTPRCFPFRPS